MLCERIIKCTGTVFGNTILPHPLLSSLATRLSAAQTCSATLAGNHLMRAAATLPENVIHGELVPFVSWCCLRVCLCCCTSICLLFCLSHGVAFYWRAGEGGATQGEGGQHGRCVALAHVRHHQGLHRQDRAPAHVRRAGEGSHGSLTQMLLCFPTLMMLALCCR